MHCNHGAMLTSCFSNASPSAPVPPPCVCARVVLDAFACREMCLESLGSCPALR